MFVSFRSVFSFRTSTSNTPRPSAHHSFRPRPQRGECKIMGWKLSKVYLGTSSRARLRTRVRSLLVQNRLMKIVVSEILPEEKSRIFLSFNLASNVSNAEFRFGQKPHRFW